MTGATHPRLRAAIYGRVSTADQNPEPQVAELRRYVAQRGWILAGEYVDVASGSNADRPQLRRLMADAFRHQFDVLCVWKLDRLGRSVSHLVSTLDELRRLQVEFVSLTESFDTKSPIGKMMSTMLAALAEFELSLRKERQSLGILAARACGKHLGRFSRSLDEKKVRNDYDNLRSLRKVALLHRCSPWLVRAVVRGKRKLLASGKDRGAH